MEKELTELFEAVKKAADAAEKSPGEEERCLDALKQLNKFPVNYQLLVSTQVGKRLRQLTKHKSHKIKALASDVVDVWKDIIVKETTKNNKNGIIDNEDSVKAEPKGAATDGSRKFQRSSSVKVEQGPSTDNGNGKFKRSNTTGTPNSEKVMKLGTSSNGKIVERDDVQTSKNAAVEFVQNEKRIKEEKPSFDRQKLASDPVGPPKLTSLVYCKDSVRDKIRELLAEALCKVSSEVDDDLRDQASASDPYRVAVLVETAMFEKWGKSTGTQKMKYRSIMFNIKDPKNPDFRRKVLLGQFEPRAILELTPEEMASDSRQMQNEKIKQKALFECERGGTIQASTDQFTCGRCKKKETTYYQMQTRSADEPMTTYVTCVNCNNRWKFC
ncbi:transcription elongation factor TFIIS-like [Olea europaea subsp. europaea]|uniref:Transcription elongation factor n=1 Tax=Olea europaea subsp. europaea TaxID=158383 RepID=A0A8S0RGU1_OLEEU|nr:transcription elongation factor TFIIS-like [Olea europaea subsp. europaea]